jgi:ATP-dependent helicase HrpB
MSKQTLPIDSFLPEIVEEVTDRLAVIVMAEPGAGKTTRVPPALLASGRGKWIVLQPRRWAAKLTAERIAEETGVRVGEEVGYQVRFENRTTVRTRLILMTEGILLRRLVDDPELAGVDGVVLDEFHERSLDLDLSLALLKEIRGSLRPDLRVVVMSATLDPVPLERFLPGVRTLKIPGRMYPVETLFRPDARPLQVWREMETGEGDTLVFLPGSREIETTVRDFEEAFRKEGVRDIEVLPLYASLPESRQKAVFRSSPKRKIICSTNIAETSLTLPGITLVIDSGWQKVMRMDPVLGLDRLETLRISRASADQRAGRAGRVQAGRCVRLWSQGEQTQLRHFETPEIQRVNLGRALMLLSEFGVRDFATFDWFEAPKSSMLDYSLRELNGLGFMDSGSLTEPGRAALRLPLEPRIAAPVLASRRNGIPEVGARLGAWLEQQGKEDRIRYEEDLLRRLNTLSPQEWKSARQIAGTDSIPLIEPTIMPKLLEVLIEADRSRVCVKGRMVGRRKVRAKEGELPEACFLFSSMDQGDVLAQSWVPLPMALLAARARKKRRVFWDEEMKRVRAVEGLFFEDLELGSLHESSATPEEAARELEAVLLRDPVGILSGNESFRRWWQRVEFYQKHAGAGDPGFHPDWNLIIPGLCSGCVRLSEVMESDVCSRISSFLERSWTEALGEFAPERLEVPTGGQIAVDYSQDPPRLAVRLQEVFGWLETPCVARGRVPVLMELLSPGFKPIQLTRDLRSFWSHAYFEVKKELKARYPKHSWPEDPLTAKPVAKGRRRG